MQKLRKRKTENATTVVLIGANIKKEENRKCYQVPIGANVKKEEDRKRHQVLIGANVKKEETKNITRSK